MLLWSILGKSQLAAEGKFVANNLILVDVPVIGGRKMLLPGEVLTITG